MRQTDGYMRALPEAGRGGSGSTEPSSGNGDHAKLPAPAILEGSFAIKVIAVILIFHVIYFAASLLVPIACALMLSMLLGPVVEALERIYVPRPVAAILVVLGSVGILAGGITMLSAPAQNWVEKAPNGLRRLEQRLEPLKRRLETISQAGEKLQESGPAASDKGPQKVVIVRPAMLELVMGTPHVVAPVFSVFMLMFLLLVAGDVFLRKLVGIIPTFKEKKRTVEIIRAIEDDISYYLRTFAALNVGLGVAMGVVTMALGIANPVLWGTLVAILNCVPYVGPVVSMAILAVVGLSTFEDLTLAMAAPAVMLVLSIVSAQIISPLVLGRGLRLNPVAIFTAVMLWGWLWGIVGVLLAVPLLASFKITCERVEPLAPLAEFLTLYVSPDEED